MTIEAPPLDTLRRTGVELISAKNYFPVLDRLIQQAQERAFLESLYIEDSPAIQTLQARASEGLPSRLKVASRVMGRGLLERLKRNSVTVDFAQRHLEYYELWQHLIPFLGIAHGKSLLIDQIGGVGGINLNPIYADRVDFMILFSNPGIVSALECYFHNAHKFKKDTELYCDPNSTLLVDIGRPLSSNIQKRALRLMREAQKEIMIISQYYPEGKVHKMLQRRALEGIHVRVIVPFAKHDLTHTLNRLVARTSINLGKEPVAYQLIRIPHYVHAKGMVVDKERTLTGSHNITAPTNNYLGLTEVAIDTTNPDTVAAVHNFIQSAVELS